MDGADTSLGGGRKAFPATTWGMLSSLRDDDGDARRAGLQQLCLRYWKPVYRFARIAWAKSNEDAKDLAQAFFLWMSEEPVLAGYDEAKGRFRTFLKVLLRRFAANQEKALHRLKRGGGREILSFQNEDLRAEEIAAGPGAGDPERAFDRSWYFEVVRRAVDEVRARYGAEGRETLFRIYEEHDWPAGAVPTCAELGARHRTDEGKIESILFAVREQVRRAIREELGRLTAGPEQLEAEWNELFGS